MNVTQSLLDFILTLLRNDDAKAAFVADPDKSLAEAGLSQVCGEDVADAMSYVAEYHPVTFVGDREASSNVAPHPEADRPDHEDRPEHHYAPEPHAAPAQQLEYITKNYSYTDSHDTLIDKSVSQNIWNHGTLAQRFDDHSVTAADHSVAAGGDLNAPVATGDNDVLGEGNSVGNTTYSDDHSVRGSFNGDNVADHGGLAGNANDGNTTDPRNSNVATGGSSVDNSPRDSHDTTADSFNDSHNRESHHTTTLDDSDNPHYSDNSHYDATDALNHQSFNDESFNHDSAITHTDQHGLINAALSPSLALPIHGNDLDVLSDSEHHLPT